MSEWAQMDQTHMENDLIRRIRRLSGLYTVLTAYHEVDDLDEMMKLALSQVLTITTGRVGSIHLLDESGETLQTVAHQSMSDIGLHEMQEFTTKDEIVYGILARNEPLVFTETPVEPRLAAIAQISGWDVFIGLPILVGKTARGVMVIYGDKNLQATVEEIELLGLIASQIGIAIENSHLREQAERLAVTEERNRMARELHDSVTQSLYSLTLFAETAKRMMDAGDITETHRYLDEIADSSQQALKEMRLLVYKLRPSSYTKGSLTASLEQRLRAVEGRSGVKYNFKADDTLILRPEVENALYGIAVEVLNNALKYARADQIWVELTRDETTIILEISDNGCGFDLEQARQSGGLGLTSIHERAVELKAGIKIDTSLGKGTTVRIRVPV